MNEPTSDQAICLVLNIIANLWMLFCLTQAQDNVVEVAIEAYKILLKDLKDRFK